MIYFKSLTKQMLFFFTDCEKKADTLENDDELIRSAVNYRLGKYKGYNQHTLEFEKRLEEFKIREGLN